MNELLPHLIQRQSERRPDAPALQHKQLTLTYGELSKLLESAAGGLVASGLGPGERVAVYLPKRIEAAAGLFAAAAAGGVFVPINPLLKPRQVGYILRDCNVRALITSADRASLLAEEIEQCHDLRTLVLVDGTGEAQERLRHLLVLPWHELLEGVSATRAHRRIDHDMTAILYTSGSTGRPKGVVLSHRNLVAGAASVSQYLENLPDDRILAVLPLSFDYGLSQLTTAFQVGACAVLMDYLLPRDVLKAVAEQRITGLAAVPPLWSQLAALEWPPEARRYLRYITNSGGAMPRALTASLRRALPDTRVFLMYGLTEAFRSTYLPPELIDTRPDSMGRAIPNAEILVVREDGSPCAPGEPGELVHRGALVALGYWNDRERTAERFRPAPGQPPEIANPEMAVWSGDQVRLDEDGLLYFVGRKDEMIKTSGYRVSPTEVEEIVYASGQVAETAALGVGHEELGQAIVVVAVPLDGTGVTEEQIVQHCRRELPNFMVPQRVLLRDALPRNPNGKIDRRALADELKRLFAPEAP